MKSLSLRLRVFLFFCLIGFGGNAVVLGALFLGYRQLGMAEAFSSFATVGIIAGFGLFALAIFIWRLFDENVSKPIEKLAAQFRVSANSGIRCCGISRLSISKSSPSEVQPLCKCLRTRLTFKISNNLP